VCNKRFSHSNSLTIHKRTHTGDKPHECDVCNKIFSQSGDLARHERTYTGDKPYECDVCNKQCCNSYSLFVTSYSYSYITKNITSYRYKLQMPKCN
jgi:uncharacterized Zn-finger protein